MIYIIIGTIVFSVIIFIFAGLIYDHFKLKSKYAELRSKHVVITGGSKGIGYALAQQCVKAGAHVTVIARNRSDLDRTKLELIKLANLSKQNIQTFSADISENVFNIERALSEAEQMSGPVHLLACCAGTSISKTFDDTSTKEYQRMMDINYFGTINTIKASMDSLKRSAKNTKGGHILIFSSIAGVFGLYGYSAYSGSKFALVGLGQCLSMELHSHKISVTISLPPDTDTPGFAEENLSKPEITRLISEDGGLMSPDEVARQSLNDTLKGEFLSSNGINGFMLTSLCAGMAPTRSFIKIFVEIFTMGIFRIFALHFLYTCYQTISKAERNDKQKEKSN
ncbi:hypothetical protein RDWZM_009085 [Blomia tropicalis]|uniref:3-dehydrosphinganine reductase n=1 Tax=Blomia tropicalis TaxID=40697 RepID=A0A9Q0RJE8_BLOTA|nr:hypothetical protein RDWZM_009085 [Blomia tropicalis]